MIIAIDFDETLSADGAMFAEAVELFRRCGHEVICVSCRRNTAENTEIINDFLDGHGMQMRIWLTGLQSKLLYMKNAGIDVDVWIDDDPTTLVNGH